MEIFNYYAERTPGSFIEHKTASLIWHYRLADPQFGEWQARECQNHIADSIGMNYSLQIHLANKALEVRAIEITKGNAIRQVLSKRPLFDFIFCAGNDRTDKDIFEYLNSIYGDSPAYMTCTVDANSIKANYFSNGPSDLVQMLRTMVQKS